MADSHRELICPFKSCLSTFSRSKGLKEHVLLHLRCRWFRCAHCPKAFFYHDNAVGHIRFCASRKAGESPGVPRERFDARYPLLRFWSLGMGLPTFKDDGSRDAFMVVGEGQVWECVRNSRVVRFMPVIVDPAISAV